jgi:hypothetical protein
LSPVGAYVGRLLGNAIPSPLQVNHDQFAALIGAVKKWWMVTGRRISRTTGATDAGVEPVTHAPGASTVPPSVPALRDHYRNGAAPTLLMALIALSTPLPSTAESGSGPQPQNERLQDNDPRVQVPPPASQP